MCRGYEGDVRHVAPDGRYTNYISRSCRHHVIDTMLSTWRRHIPIRCMVLTPDEDLGVVRVVADEGAEDRAALRRPAGTVSAPHRTKAHRSVRDCLIAHTVHDPVLCLIVCFLARVGWNVRGTRSVPLHSTVAHGPTHLGAAETGGLVHVVGLEEVPAARAAT